MKESTREEIFHKHFKGMASYKIAKIFLILNPTIDYRGCGKKVMLDAWVRESELTRKYKGFTQFTEDDLIMAIKKELNS